jgi:hypothetical protein
MSLFPDAEAPRELLGTVTAPSGVLLLVDGGALPLWAPEAAGGAWAAGAAGATPEAPAASWGSGGGTLDLRVEGRDAEAAGRAFDRQWHPRYLFDVPRAAVRHLEAQFHACARRKGLDAQLVPLVRRVPHRERAALALAHGGGAGVVQFHGVWAVAVGGLPAGAPLPLVGSRLPEDVEARRWRTVSLEVRPGTPVARSEQVGFVVADGSRLMVADVDALGGWRPGEPLDGRADVVLGGAEAPEAARRMGARPLPPGDVGPGHYGWLDVPLEVACELLAVAQRVRATGLCFTHELVPHGHAWAMGRQLRGTATGSGQLEVAGARLCEFLTTWGDGGFPVFRDVDAGGALVRVRVELGNAHVARLRGEQERSTAELSRLALVSSRVLQPGGQVRFLYREAPHAPDMSGWCLLSQDEAPPPPPAATGPHAGAPAASPGLRPVPLRELLALDPALEEVLRTPPGSAFVRLAPGGPFVPVSPFTQA